jgi:hypothetical protein
MARHPELSIGQMDQAPPLLLSLYLWRLKGGEQQFLFAKTEEVLNGLITNDKFCMIRWGSVELSWWRRPLRLRAGSG